MLGEKFLVDDANLAASIDIGIGSIKRLVEWEHSCLSADNFQYV